MSEDDAISIALTRVCRLVLLLEVLSLLSWLLLLYYKNNNYYSIIINVLYEELGFLWISYNDDNSGLYTTFTDLRVHNYHNSYCYDSIIFIL